jgi:hypothetical protein
MLKEQNPAASHRLLSLAAKFHDEEYRNGYIASHTRGVLAKQMRNFRGTLSQEQFAEKLDKQKTVIARLEKPAYAGWSLRTMLEVARKEKVALLCRFVDFPTFLNFTDDMTDDALDPQSYDEVKTEEIVSYLTGAKTYFDLGAGYGFAGGTAMEAMTPAPYGDIFFGANQTGMTLAARSSGTLTLSNVPSGIVGQSIWLGTNPQLGQNAFSAGQSVPWLPSGVARTQAAVRWLTNLAMSQKSQIEALQSEVALLRQASSTQPIETQSAKISPFPKHPRRQTFGNPLDAVEVA